MKSVSKRLISQRLAGKEAPPPFPGPESSALMQQAPLTGLAFFCFKESLDFKALPQEPMAEDEVQRNAAVAATCPPP